jgi:2-haloacid dehalogenase
MSDRAAPGPLIFDLGGVVVDWDPRHLYDRLIPDPGRRRVFLTEICSPEWNRLLDGAVPMEEMVQRRCAEFPDWVAEIRAYRDRWPEMLGRTVAGTPELLEELRAAGAPLFAVTNWSADTFPAACERFEVFGVFTDIVVSGRVGLVKPDPAIYELALERFGVARETGLFVDDQPANVAAAQALGLPAVRFTDAATLRAHPAVAAHLTRR